MVSGEEQAGDISIYRLYQGHSILIYQSELSDPNTYIESTVFPHQLLLSIKVIRVPCPSGGGGLDRQLINLDIDIG